MTISPIKTEQFIFETPTGNVLFVGSFSRVPQVGETVVIFGRRYRVGKYSGTTIESTGNDLTIKYTYILMDSGGLI